MQADKELLKSVQSPHDICQSAILPTVGNGRLKWLWHAMAPKYYNLQQRAQADSCLGYSMLHSRRIVQATPLQGLEQAAQHVVGL